MLNDEALGQQEKDKADELVEEVQRIRENERFKFIAAALDRLSTAFLGIGALGLVVAAIFGGRPASVLEPVKLGVYVICTLISYALHLLGRRYLERLR